MIKLKMYPAKNGDAFLIDASGVHILIDAGYESTFTDYIISDLTRISQAGDKLNLVVSTHIDTDHIGGINKFILLNGFSGERNIIEVDDIWHNSLHSISPSTASPDAPQDIALLQSVSRKGIQTSNKQAINQIGVKQGLSLARKLRKFAYTWNSGNGRTCINNLYPPLHLPHGVRLQVLNPSVERLEALRDWWLREMRRLGYRGNGNADEVTEDAYETWCCSVCQPEQALPKPISAPAYRRLGDIYTPDTSITNASSIALALYTNELSGLFLGDARAEDILEELKRTNPHTKTHLFDVIKIAHHGSVHNTSTELLAHIDAPYFLISSDASKHSHPDFEVLTEIVDRPANFERKLFFNYDTPAARRLLTHTSRSGAHFSIQIVNCDWIHIIRENR